MLECILVKLHEPLVVAFPVLVLSGKPIWVECPQEKIMEPVPDILVYDFLRIVKSQLRGCHKSRNRVLSQHLTSLPDPCDGLLIAVLPAAILVMNERRPVERRGDKDMVPLADTEKVIRKVAAVGAENEGQMPLLSLVDFLGKRYAVLHYVRHEARLTALELHGKRR